jgi:hypothetical protein
MQNHRLQSPARVGLALYIFTQRLDWLWGPPSPLYFGYMGSFAEGG